MDYHIPRWHLRDTIARRECSRVRSNAFLFPFFDVIKGVMFLHLITAFYDWILPISARPNGLSPNEPSSSPEQPKAKADAAPY